jgi:uncharacterized membrane protein YGL010W
MRSVQSWLDEYAESHQNSFNIIIHWVCVPLIMFSIIGLLANIPLNIFFLHTYPQYSHMGLVIIFFGSLYYFFLSRSLFLGMLPISMIMLYIIQLISNQNFSLWKISLGIFVLSWIGQFYGHKIEGKKPSFFKDIQFLMIGPLWLLSKLYKRLGIRY